MQPVQPAYSAGPTRQAQQYRMPTATRGGLVVGSGPTGGGGTAITMGGLGALAGQIQSFKRALRRRV